MKKFLLTFSIFIFSLETFSKSLPIAQETVKKLNGGSLPTLIQPEIKKKPKKH